MTVDLSDENLGLITAVAKRFSLSFEDALDGIIREWRRSTLEEIKAQTARRHLAERAYLARARSKVAGGDRDVYDGLDLRHAWSDGFRTGWLQVQTRRPDCLPTREEPRT